MARIRLNKDKPMSYNDFVKNVCQLTSDRESMVKSLEQQLLSYELKYHMTSEAFYTLYNAGRLEDIHDFAVWAGKYYLYREATSRNR